MFSVKEPMAVRRCGCLYPVTFLLLMAGWGQSETVIAAVGSNVTMVPDVPAPFRTITWLYNTHMIVEMDVDPQPDVQYYTHKDRATIDSTTGALTITRLTLGDSGDYKAEVFLRNSTIINTYKKLNVLDRVSPPTITNSTTEERIIVTCDYAAADVSYRWMMGKEIVSQGRTYNVSRPKEAVTLTCVISNPVSENRTSVTIPKKEEVPVIAIVIPIIILLLLIGFLIWYCRKRLCMKQFTERLSYEKAGQAEQQDVFIGKKPTESIRSITVTIYWKVPACISRITIDGRTVLPGNGEGEKPDSSMGEPACNIIGVHFSGGSGNTVRVATNKPGQAPDTNHENMEVVFESLSLSVMANRDLGCVTITYLAAERDGVFKAKVHYDEREVTAYEFRGKKNGEKTVLNITRKMIPQPPESGAMTQGPISTITYHPGKMANDWNWKWDNRELFSSLRKGESSQKDNMEIDWQTGDLTLQDVMPKHSGTYTLASDAPQEFTLHVAGVPSQGSLGGSSGPRTQVDVL